MDLYSRNKLKKLSQAPKYFQNSFKIGQYSISEAYGVLGWLKGVWVKFWGSNLNFEK